MGFQVALIKYSLWWSRGSWAEPAAVRGVGMMGRAGPTWEPSIRRVKKCLRQQRRRLSPRHPFDPRAPRQAAIPRDREDCNMVCEHAKYKHAFTNTHHMGTRVKNQHLQENLHSASAAHASPALTTMQMGHEGAENPEVKRSDH